MRVTVLGMGRMGHAVAGRLLEGGHEVTVWNRSPGKADDLAAGGATDCSGKPAGEAVEGAEVTLTSLSDDAAVRAVVLDGGLAEALAEGAVLADASTVAPETTLALAEGVGPDRFVATPILGAPSAVSAGEAVYLVAGPPPAVERLRPLLDALGGKVRDLGEDPGRALAVKLLANALLLSGIAVLGEVVATAQAAGIDDAFLTDFLGSSPLVAPGLRNRVEAIVSGEHAAWFTTALGAKDVRLAEELAARHRLRLPVLEAVKRRYEEAALEGYGEDDLSAVVELVRRQASSSR